MVFSICLWTVPVAFSMYSTVAGQYNQRKAVEKIENEENLKDFQNISEIMTIIDQEEILKTRLESILISHCICFQFL